MQAVGDFSGKLEDDLLFCEQCRLFFRESCPRHGTPHFVRDAPVEGERERGRGRRRERSVGGCRAVLSLPQGLELRERGSAGGTLGVFCAQSVLPQGWIFGPYEGEVLLDRQECTVYSWAIKENGSYFYVDASDESSSNWMRYVACASNEEEHNLTAFQYRGRIYYRTNRPVSAGTELLVWIGEEYAHTLGLRLGEHFKYEFGEKELLMRLFQDLQVPPSSLAARPRPSSSSSSSSSAGRPGNGDPSAAAAAAGSTRSQAGLESRASGAPCGQPGQCGAPVSSGCPPYPFLEGTQNLVSLGRAQSRYWTFFGFQGDALGRILDKTKIVCKLCAVRLSYSGNTTNLRQHLVYKHRPEYNQLVGAAPPLPPAPPAPSPPAGPGPGPAAALIPRSGRPHDGAAPPAPAARPPPAPRAPTHAIADFLVRDLLPPETVEGEGFVQLIAALRPSCAVPSAACLSRTVLREAHRRGRERGAELLRGGSLAGPGPVSAAGSGSDSPLSSSSSSSSLLLGSGVALSADVWRHGAPGPPASYVTLSAHFVDDGFACRHLVLSTRRLGAGPGGGGGGGGDVRAVVRAAAQEWGVEEPSFLVLGAAETGLWDGTGEGEAGEEEEEEEEAGAKKRGQGTPSEQQQGKQGKREWGSRSEQGDGGEEEEEEGGGPRGKRGRGGGEEGASRSEQGDRGGADPELFRAAPEEGALEGGDPEPPAPGGAAWPPIPCAGAALRECVERVLGRPDVSRALRRARALAGRLLAAEPRGRESPPPSPSPSSSSSSSSGLDGHPQLKRCLRALAQGGPRWQEAYGLVQALADSRPLMAELLARAEASGRGGERPPSGPEPCPPASPYPQGSDWLLLRELAAVLKPLAVACGTLARERYPGLSLLRPVLAGLVSRHFAPRAADSAFARAAKRALRESLVRAYGQPGLRRALNLACALDPRFRGLDFLEPGERVDTFARLRREVAGLAGEAGWGGEAGRGGPGRGEAGGGRRGLGSAGEGGGQSRDQDSREAGGGAGHGGGEGAPSARKRPRRAGGEEEGEGGAGPAPEYEPVRIGAEAGSGEDEGGEGAEEEERGPAPGREEEEEGEAGGEGRGPASSSSSTPPGRAAPSGIEFLLGDLCGARARSASQRAEREIAAFRAEDGAPLAADPLLWWRARRAQFPLLARAARRFLAPPATAAPAPWLLTEAGAAVLRRRAALPPESLDQLLFLHGNQLSVETDP